jgi:prevent-host-death family protein
MTIASISETKAKLSALLDRVREGETVTITDRGVPVAQIVPLPKNSEVDWEARLDRLERAGLIKRGRGGRADILLTPPPDVGGSVLELLLEERREGR